jgi:hypothetical protein
MICDNLKNKKCIINLAIIIALIAALGFIVKCLYDKMIETKKLAEQIEYIDSLNKYNKIYYDTSFNSLKKTNKELYDSLKCYKDEISYLIQFKHEKEYNTGQVNNKPTVKDSQKVGDKPITIQPIAKTYEYKSEPNDTFQYKLQVNSLTEPNWYKLNAKVSQKFTIVNKEDGNGGNHITIDPHDGNSTITDVTTFKKENKKKFWDRFSFGPGVTAGYDPINKRFGLVVGVTAAYDLK